MSRYELKYALGDKVIVVDDGKAYNQYTRMAELMRLNNHAREYIKPGTVATVVAVCLHRDRDDGIVLGLQAEDGLQYIIGQNGVESTQSQVDDLKAQIAKLQAKLAQLS